MLVPPGPTASLAPPPPSLHRPTLPAESKAASTSSERGRKSPSSPSKSPSQPPLSAHSSVYLCSQTPYLWGVKSGLAAVGSCSSSSASFPCVEQTNGWHLFLKSVHHKHKADGNELETHSCREPGVCRPFALSFANLVSVPAFKMFYMKYFKFLCKYLNL